MENNIVDEFNLPKYVKGKSFAEASKAIDKKFQDREDSFSEATKKELLGRLAEAQEHIKMKEELASNSNQMDLGGVRPQVQSVNELTPQGVKMNPIDIKADTSGLMKNATGTPDIEGVGAGSVVNAASTLLDFGNDMFGKTGIDTSGLAGRQEKENVGMGAASSALKGASAGAAFGPIGAAAGAVIGGVSGLIGGSRANKEIQEANMNTSRIENNKFSNDFAKGGLVNQYGAGDWLKKLFTKPKNVIDYEGIDDTFANMSVGDGSGVDASIGGAAKMDQKQSTKELKSPAGKAANWMKNNYDSILNTAPILANALQLANMEKADPVTYDRLDGRYKRNIVDERVLENKVQNEATNTAKALANATNGSAGALRSNLLGVQLQKTNALSDAYLKATQMNQEDDRFGQQFDRQADMVNQRTSIMEANERRADEGAYESNKSMMTSALAQNIGDFGKQQMHKKMAIEATDYGWDGKYYVNKKDGTRITAKQYNKIFGLDKKEEQDNGED